MRGSGEDPAIEELLSHEPATKIRRSNALLTKCLFFGLHTVPQSDVYPIPDVIYSERRKEYLHPIRNLASWK